MEQMKNTTMDNDIQEQLKGTLLNALSGVINTGGLTVKDIHLEHPADFSHGDYATNIGLSFFKKHISELTEKNIYSPLAFAEKIVSSIDTEKIKTVEAVKPGFINIFLSQEFLYEQMMNVIAGGDGYGKKKLDTPEKLLIEFAHPNTHKLFHIGHLRNICLGESLCRILSAAGNTIIRCNYQGDVGMHIAKCIWAIQKLPRYRDMVSDLQTPDERTSFLGERYANGSQAYETDERAKQEINQINKEIYEYSPHVAELYETTRQWSLEYFDRIYKRLYTEFDRLYFEHEVWQRGQEIVNEFLTKGIFEKSEGAVIFPGEKYGLHNRVFINSQGLPTYEAKDMGLGELQFKEYNPDRLIHLVGPEQKGYFEVIFKALEMVNPKTKGKELHKSYGWVRLKEGKMSSRMGNVVAGEDLIEAAKEKLSGMFTLSESAKNNDILEQIAVGAVKYSMLKYAPETEFVFDVDESVSLDGNSGPYLQYTYARCRSVLQKTSGAEIIGYGNSTLEPAESALLRKLYRFPEVVRDSAIHLAPNVVANYLYDLVQSYNLFYSEHSILKAEEEKKQFRLSLTRAVSIIIKNGLDLLGILTPESM